MNFLQTTRVAVIDDELAEAEPLLCSISKSGIGALYFNGINDQLPAKPLSGLRLLFLDLHLVNAGNVHGILSTTIGILAQVVAPSKGEVGIVCWTKHAEEQKEFEELLKSRFSTFQPAFVLAIPKRDFFTESGAFLDMLSVEAEKLCGTLPVPTKDNPQAETAIEVANKVKNRIKETIIASEKEKDRRHNFNFGELESRVDGVLAPKNGSKLMWAWEQSVHDAASGTASLLHTICGDSSDSEVHETDMMSVFASLVIGAGGSAVTDNAACACSFSEGLNPIHSDFLEQFSRNPSAEGEHYSALLEKVLLSPKLDPGKRAQINSAILTAKTQSSAFQPGNLYIPTDDPTICGCPHKICALNKYAFVSEMLLPKYEKKHNELKLSLKAKASADWPKEKSDEVKAAIGSIEWSEFENLYSETIMGLLEISPACDFSNKSFAPARLIGCLLVPDRIQDRIAKGDFIRRIKPIMLPEKPGIWHILLNSRNVFGISNPKERIATAPIIRIRLPLLIDIQAWFAAQSARPGHIAV